MRIVIDMQGAQTGSRFRGIGRYTMGIAEAIVRNAAKGDEILLAMNGRLGSGIDAIRKAFRGTLSPEAFKVWYAPGPLSWTSQDSAGRRDVAQRIWARFIESLRPDAVLCTTLFDNPGEDLIAAPSLLPSCIATGAIVYDFIPLHQPEVHLASEGIAAWYDSRLAELKSVGKMFCISDYVAAEASERFPGADAISISTDTSSVFRPLADGEGRADVQPVAGRFDGRPFVLYTGGTDDRKNLSELVEAYGALPDGVRDGHQLAIVCGNHPETHRKVLRMVEEAGIPGKDLVLMGYLPDEDMRDLYARCRLFVFPSLDEGFGLPVLEAMRCNAPVIASDATSIPEVMGLSEALFSPTDAAQLTARMLQGLTDDSFRDRLVRHSAAQQARFSWDASAKKLLSSLRGKKASAKAKAHADALRGSPIDDPQSLFAFCRQLSASCQGLPVQTADAIARTFGKPGMQPQLFVDISELCHIDAGTGIQRVTRSILAYLLKHPPEGYAIRPVYATSDRQGYRYAHRYLLKKYGFDDGQGDDFAVEFSHRDVFFGLDLQSCIVPRQQSALLRMHRHGVRIWFVVYDLIPIQFPQYVHEGNEKIHALWLKTISLFDGAMCISQAVADDLRAWVAENARDRADDFDIRWFHLGSDIKGSVPSKGLPSGAKGTLDAMKARPTFLMVSTIEPRKGYAQALAAFDLLWKSGVDVNLTIVGKEGWVVRSLADRIRNHPENGRRLFWLKGISDEYLEKAYDASAAVVMASEAEGFGLAVVEGARHGKPLVLRDLPVFREIAGDSAFYFHGFEAKDLADAIRRWLDLSSQGKAPSSDGVESLTWDDSAKMLLERLPL